MSSDETKATAGEETKEDQQNAKQQEDGKPEQAPSGGESRPTTQPSRPTVHKTNYEKDVVYLYQFSRTPVLPSLSPYCLKVETWLRLAGLKYEVCKQYVS